ncbi:hypothetical protein SDC9_153872 [bioreactor metagenome]|uniref:Uncharacterized protein n=1 Tax=bioreactor metagenome TaxID=1076179 RepID=A0A645EYV5_9ZZZZ
MLLQTANMPYDKDEFDKIHNDYKNRTFRPVIEPNAYRRRYYNEPGIYAYDNVNMIALLKTHFLYGGMFVEPYIEQEKEVIRTFIEAHGGTVFNTRAKTAKSVIEFGTLDSCEYEFYKEEGYEIFHSLHVIQFINKYSGS